jgi:hypothetical protein
MKTVYLNLAPARGINKIFISLTVVGNPETRSVIKTGLAIIRRTKIKDIVKVVSVRSEMNRTRVVKDIGVIK